VTAASPDRARAAFGWVFAALAAGCVFPLFYVRYPPVQDLPQHVATVRVLADFGDPALGFARYFTVDLLRTQYLAYYLCAQLLAQVMDVELACKLLIAASLAAAPLAARGLLESLGKDGRLALLLFPLTYNAHLVLGFLNFLAAIPLLLYGLTLAVRERRTPAPRRAVALALLAVVTFYTHVVPFAVLALGVVLVACARDLRRFARGVLPLLPAAIAALIWLAQSPAGQATWTAARGTDAARKPFFMPAEQAWAETPRWLTDVLGGGVGLDLLYAWLALIALSLLLAAAERIARLRGAAPSPAAPDALSRSLALRLALLAPLCAALYFVSPTSYDWIWPIAQRFPLLAAVFLVVALPGFRIGKSLLLVLAIALGAASSHYAGKAFAAFEREEVGDFDRALEQLPGGQRVVGLIFDRGSRHVAFSPFIHFVAYYQARKGGAVMFSFAEFPQSPFRFREDNRPPRVPPRWEWLPQRVRPRTELGFYDYALVRGGPGAIARGGSGFTPAYRGERWSVWKRSPGASSSTIRR
jgi:hypothetical protein